MKSFLLFRLLPCLPLCFTCARSQQPEDESLPGNPPKVMQGVITCADGSRWFGITFQARLGLAYFLESSTDLVEWETVDPLPGGGQEQTYLLKQLPELPGPVPPSAPVVPALPRKNVQLLVQPAATGGGMVVSWKSLEDGTPLRHAFPALQMIPEWDLVPMFAPFCDDYQFFISHPNLAIAPPAANLASGTADQEMLDAFEAHFPDMNAQIAASVERARSQPVAAAASSGRKFWRVRCDWGVDSDQDGTPDWMEYEQLFAAAAGTNTVSGPTPDPLDGDADQDGIPDGAQRDSDGDGIPDTEDTVKDDPLIDWQKGTPFRFAVFPIHPPENEAVAAPVQINDLGDVLFPTFLSSGGVSRKWATTATVKGATGLFLDDLGTAYTEGQVLLPGAPPEGSSGIMVIYDRNAASPQIVSAATQDQGTMVTAYAQFPPTGAVPDMRTWADGTTRSFLSVAGKQAHEPPDGLLVSLSPRNAWTFGPGGFSLGSMVPPDRQGFGPANEPWGTHDGQAGPYLDAHQFSQAYQRIALLPSGNPVALAANLPTLIRKNGQWLPSRSLDKDWIDFSRGGRFGIRSEPLVWFNGSTHFLRALAPGIPDEWSSYQTGRLIDTTPGGWIVMKRHPAGMPHATTAAASALPLFAIDDLPSTGLDTLSATAQAQTSGGVVLDVPRNKGIQKEFWVMVPAGGETKFRLRSPLGPGTSATLGGGVVTVDPATVSSNDALLTLSAPLSADGTSAPVPVKFGPLESMTVPLRAKIMKPRTLRLTLWPIHRATPGRPLAECAALPPEQEIETYLNGIFQPQLNLTVDVTIKAAFSVDYDIADNAGTHLPPPDPGNPATTVSPRNGMFDVNSPPTTEQTAITLGREEGNINVYVVGGSDYFWPWSVSSTTGRIIVAFPLAAIADRDTRCCWISSATLIPKGSDPPRFFNTLAHEMGHVLFGEGHPNQDSGPAPLPGTDHNIRLMGSSLGVTYSHSNKKQIVKAEWDEAEEWMKDNLDP